MIHPVRSVGETSLAVQCMVLDAPLAVRWRLARLGRIFISDQQLAALIPLLDGTWAARCAWVGGGVLRALAATGSAATLARCQPGDPLPAVDSWQAWPARRPFADDVDRWWPSEELPPIEHEPPSEGPAIRPVPEFPLYPVRGGLLSVWA
jgi:hypothetical protein